MRLGLNARVYYNMERNMDTYNMVSFPELQARVGNKASHKPARQ